MGCSRLARLPFTAVAIVAIIGLGAGLAACSGGIAPSYSLEGGSRALEGDERIGGLGLIADEQSRADALATLRDDGSGDRLDLTGLADAIDAVDLEQDFIWFGYAGSCDRSLSDVRLQIDEDSWDLVHGEEEYDLCAQLYEHRYLFVIDRRHLPVFQS